MTDSPASTVDWETDVYAHGRQLNLWPYSRLVSAVLRETAGTDRRGIRILEIGCGAGNNIWFLARSGFMTSGLDSSPTAISFAANRLKEENLQADLSVGDIVDLPHDDEAFHYVLDRGALTQNPHAQITAALSEARRVLVPGGKIFSFDLFGLECPDRRFGTEVSHHCFDHFTAGPFQSIGRTAFFDFDDLRSLFVEFAHMEASRVLETAEDGRVIGEFYDVVASR